jgi:hypothetical protein
MYDMRYRNQIESEGYNPRLLHERSFLTFEFPMAGEKISRAYLPMLENCDVSESQKSNLAEYSLLGRSGSIYSYLGAKSRMISLTFKITLQHVIETLGTEGISERFKQIFTKVTSEKERFFPGNSDRGKNVNFDYINHARVHANYYNTFLTTVSNDSDLDRILGGRSTENIISDSIGTPIFYEDQNFDFHFKTINLILWWTNLIRSSVKNNSQNTVYGCPIVRLTHGPMYNNIPCLVENYNIKVNEQVGYDVYTLLPKQLEISVSLIEERTGDFTEFKSGETIRGDNLTGWESIISENNMDPYNGIIVPEKPSGPINGPNAPKGGSYGVDLRRFLK